jgi:hypothetical protein
MRHAAIVIGLCGAVLMGSSWGAEPASQSVSTKRQIIDCMSKRMSANRLLSYNDAMRACKDKLQPRQEALAGINPSEAGVKAH